MVFYRPYLWLVLVLCAAGAYAQTPEFSRYRVILERKPFGEAPPPEPEPIVIPEREKFERNFRMSAIVEIQGEWKIGLIELKTKESFYLGVGESEKGVELVDVDWDTEEATIRKGLEMVILQLGTGEVESRVVGQDGAPAAPAQRTPQQGERRGVTRPGRR
jgi:hypothetical protein